MNVFDDEYIRQTARIASFRMPTFDVEGPREEPSALELKVREKMFLVKLKTRRKHGKARFPQRAA